MKYKFLIVILLLVSRSMFALSDHIELYQVHNNTDSDIQLNIEFNQTLSFKFNRATFELLGQDGVITQNSVRKEVQENIVIIKPNESISIFSISWTRVTEKISSVVKISQILDKIDIRDNSGNLILDLDSLKAKDILEIPFSETTFQYILEVGGVTAEPQKSESNLGESQTEGPTKAGRTECQSEKDTTTDGRDESANYAE